MTVKVIIFFYTLNAIASQLLLKRAIVQIGGPRVPADVPSFLLATALSPWAQLSICLQVLGLALWAVVVSKEKLGVAFALSASTFYLLLALSSSLLYGERLNQVQWIGITLITMGVICLTGLPTGRTS